MPRIRTTRWPQPTPGRTYRKRLKVARHELHQAWVEFLGHLHWEWFVTLTFGPKRVSDVSRERANGVSAVVRRLISTALAHERRREARRDG